MKIFVTSYFTSADFGLFGGRGFRTEGQSGLFFFGLQRCWKCFVVENPLVASGLG